MMLKKRFDASNYKVNIPLPTGKKKKAIALMKDELGGKIMKNLQHLDKKFFIG